MRRALLFLALSAVAAAALADGARYVIIAADGLEAEARPLADWKTRKGVPAVVVTAGVMAWNPDSLRNFLRNAWENWSTRPEYVLLLGSPALIRSYGDRNDCWFGSTTGDYVMELSVGRLPAANATQCRTLVNKVLAYENPPAGADMGWCEAGATVIREDVPPDPYYRDDTRLVHDLWRNAAFGTIDSMADFSGNTSSDIDRAGCEGRGFVTYRGRASSVWYDPFGAVRPDTWRNGHRLPIVVSATCATVTLAPYESMYGDQFVLAGTPEELSGAAAFFGTTRSGSSISMYRSACFRGFFDALYLEGECRLGPATLRARYRVDSLYQDVARYCEWNLLGDPELNVRTAKARAVSVDHAALVQTGVQAFPVHVDEFGTPGQPVRDALVCVSMDSTVYDTARTDALGNVTLEIAPTDTGEMSIVVTGRNLLPHEGTCTVVPGSGVTDRAPLPGSHLPVPAVAAGIIRLPMTGGVLLDACGRRVMGLAPGANDITRLVPGVYFVLPETNVGAAARPQRVVVVR